MLIYKKKYFRPHDYFAEMAKTDEHMQKVRRNIAKRQVITEKVEKVS